MSGTYSINNAKTTPIFVDTNKDINTKMRNNILGAVVYLSTAIVFGGSTALLMLFIKENSDRCHYYNGKWNKKDLAIGISSIILGSIAKYFITLI